MEWFLLKNPALVCSNCYQVKKDEGIKPKCETAKGCPIIDIAPSRSLLNRCVDFCDFQHLKSINAPEYMLREKLEQIKINSRTLIKATLIYNQWQVLESKRATTREEYNKRINGN